MQTLSRLAALAGFASFALWPGPTGFPAHAQGWPDRAVKLVVPFPAGGPLDSTARLLAERLAGNLKQPFIIENRPGLAGNVGTDAVAKAAPDGYTLLVVLDTPLTVSPALYAKLPYDPERDLVPISLIATFSQMLVVHPTVSANTLAEFVALAKTGSLTYGSGGARGNPGHLTMESLRMHTGFDLVHVAYKGNPQVVADLVGGHVQAGFLATPGVIGLVREGKLKGLAVSSLRRAPGAPNVPTVAEAGYPGFDVGFAMVLLAPSKTPASIRAVLENEVVQAVKSPDVQTRLRSQELEPLGTTGTEAASWLKTAAAKWKSVIQTAKIQHD